ncbi:MAG: DUF4864 domain-containing protein [Betaproteobacteria bacterium]|nr:DUF4864 domain-containing protein [Betaproteobacteria bacterium]
MSFTRTRRHWQALLGAALLALACGSVAQDLGREEVGAMQRVIDAQLEAFARDDEQRAFAFASPGIQERFGTAATFAQMVREQYAVVYRPASRAFLRPVVEQGTVIFPVQLSDRDGRVWVALYTMQRVAGAWRIAGCQLVPATATAT